MLGQAGPDTFCYYWSLGGSFVSKLVHTLASGIDVSPTFIDFGFFSILISDLCIIYEKLNQIGLFHC